MLARVRRAGRRRGRARAFGARPHGAPPAREGTRHRARDPALVPARGRARAFPASTWPARPSRARRGGRRLLRLHPGLRDAPRPRRGRRLGQGYPAALLMAGFRMSLLAEIRNEFAIRAVMRKANSLLHESTRRDKFVTAFYGVLDWRNSILIFSNAGHNPPLVMHRDGTTEHLLDGGLALGVLPVRATRSADRAARGRRPRVLHGRRPRPRTSRRAVRGGAPRAGRARNADRPAAELLTAIVDAVVVWTGSAVPATISPDRRPEDRPDALTGTRSSTAFRRGDDVAAPRSARHPNSHSKFKHCLKRVILDRSNAFDGLRPVFSSPSAALRRPPLLEGPQVLDRPRSRPPHSSPVAARSEASP